jgi:ubiquinone/menaquinone biosynthesis C-methylase UbiE
LLLEQIAQAAKRVLDLGTADGRLLALLKLKKPTLEGVALDFSKPMIEQAKKRFANDKHIAIFKYDFSCRSQPRNWANPFNEKKKKKALPRNI